MPSRPNQQGITSLFLFQNSLEGILFSISLLSLPADPKNAIFAGYSLSRLVMVIGMAAASALFLIFAIRERKSSFLYNRLKPILPDTKLYNAVVRIILVLAFFAGTALLVAGRLYGRYELYTIRLKPALLWFILILIQSVVVLVFLKKRTAANESLPLKAERSTTRLFLLIGVILIAVWAFLLLSGMGIMADQYYWNEAGVPLLWVQVVFALVIAFAIHRIAQALRIIDHPASRNDTSTPTIRKLLPDIGFFFLLWILSAVILIKTPQQAQPWAPGKYPPHELYYPIADAMDYYISAEFAVIGQHLANDGLSDKPLYTILIFFLQLITGDDFVRLTNWHVIVMALYMPLLYILGKILHSRKAGIFLALLAVFYEYNAITSTAIVNLPTVKILMSEVLVRIGLLVLAILFISAFKNRKIPLVYLAAAGAVLGWNTLIRYNTWLLLPLLLALVFFTGLSYFRGKYRLAISAVFLAGCFLAISGWMAREELTHSNALFFLSRFSSTVWSGRYFPSSDSEPNAAATPAPVEIQANEPETDQPSVTPASSTRILPLPAAFANHFFHNAVSSLVSLPVTFRIDSLYRTIKGTPIYSYDWAGEIKPAEILLSVFNLLLIAAGLVYAWKRHSWAGLMPAILFAGYHAGNAVALTSGNRYVLPVLWCILFYYAVGLLEAICWVSKKILITDLKNLPEEYKLDTGKRPSRGNNIKTIPCHYSPGSYLAGQLGIFVY